MGTRQGARLAALGAGAALALALAAPAMAGGWATATIDDGAGPRAGEPTEVGFTLLHHGQRPISWEQATFVATNAETGESVRAPARPSGGPGHYVATVTFPSNGDWRWHLELRDLLYGLPDGSEGREAAQPLAVGPPPNAIVNEPRTTSTGTDVTLLAGIGALMFLIGAFVGSFAGGSRRRADVSVPEHAPVR